MITSTLGKALGGASGGFTSGRADIIALLRQRSRTYLFSNTLAPIIAHTTLRVLEFISSSTALRDKLASNTKRFRCGMSERGFAIRPGEHPIVPIMLGDAARAANMAERLLAEGVYVVGFSYPVVPLDTARIRVQVSAAHSEADLDFAMAAFARVQQQLNSH
jgi:glycine C-acetyltransferase